MKKNKKLLQFIKRAAALMSVVMVLFCSFVIPSFAVDTHPNLYGTVMQPFFNYDYIRIVYDNQTEAVFSLKDVFYDVPMSDATVTYTLNDYSGTRSLTVTLTDVHFDQINYNAGDGYVSMPYWRLSFDFDTSFVISVSIGCSESVYNYELLSTVYNLYSDKLGFYSSSDNPVSCSYSNDSVFYYPIFSHGENDQIIGRQLASYDLSYSSNSFINPRISPIADVSTLASMLPEEVFRKYIYFSGFTSTFHPNDVTDHMSIDVFYIPESHVISFKEYHDTYFPSYRFDDMASVDFTGWITTAVGGFLSFEFLPNISFGTLLLFMLGVGAFNVFLKFFAGG